MMRKLGQDRCLYGTFSESRKSDVKRLPLDPHKHMTSHPYSHMVLNGLVYLALRG